MTTTIITSAAYVVDELAAEFGWLPPAFLPVGHKRLYDLQVEVLGQGLYLTIPEDYVVPEADLARFSIAGIESIRVPRGLKLGESVLYALEMIGDTSSGVRIMHGDTMIYDLPEGSNVVAVGQQPEAYEWGHVTNGGSVSPDDNVLAGYFAFSDGVALRRALAASRGDFVGAVNLYKQATGLSDALVTSWLDFGHLQTYYRSRCSIRTQRAFNDLDISFRTVTKRSTEVAKLSAERAWYESLPSSLRLYTPAYLGGANDHYAVEYLPIPSLHELFVFGDLPPQAWRTILESAFQFMTDCISEGGHMSPPAVIHELTTAKTFSRLEQFETAAGLAPDAEWRYAGRPLGTLRQIAKTAEEHINGAARQWLGVMHGDLCFTNMFYDFRTRRIRVIDPRGTIDGSTPTVLGDVRYDMAKLNHSITGAYDYILAGRYACSGFDERDVSITFPAFSSIAVLNALRSEFAVAGLKLSDPQVTAITIHLFLSMLPLHADRPDRQKAFLTNALRLYAEGLS